MGFNVHLIAVSGKAPELVHKEFGVVAAGQYEEFPESAVAGASLSSGLYALYINDRIAPDDVVLARLSQNASLITCNVSETVMTSTASQWVDGIQRWTVIHDAYQGALHLEATGDLPSEYWPIREKLFALQGNGGDVDHVFDIPVELFQAMGGIRYTDNIEGAGPKPWQVLKRLKGGQTLGKKRRWPFG